jgi:hypothetical protein
MPMQKKPIRKRPAEIKVMATEQEKRMMLRAAKRADLPLSTWLRQLGMREAKREG